MASTTKRKRFTAAQREAVLTQYRTSDLTQDEFTRQQGISLATLHRWRHRTRVTASAKPTFVPVPNPLTNPGTPAGYRLQWPGGLTVEVRAGFVPQELAALLQLLPKL